MILRLILMKIQKRRNTMSTTEVAKSSKEYMTVPIAELIESNTNPRKVFDQSFLEELQRAFAIGAFSRPACAASEQPSGNCCGRATLRAAKLAGLEVAPIRLKAMTDLEAQEAQQIEMCNARTCIPSRRRKAIARFLFEGANYTLKNLLPNRKRPQERG